MGCCFSCDENDGYSGTEPIDERTRLLVDPAVDRPGTRPPPSSTPPKGTGDEQSALNRILHQTANNVIDVSALESNMEQQEYMDRARHYSNRLAFACNSSQSQQSENSLVTGVAAPQSILAAQPVSITDLQLVCQATEQASKAVKEVKVKHKEDLVVPFGVP